MKRRYVTINSVIRKYQIETNRTEHLLEDETELHDAQSVLDFSEAVRRGFPDAQITWALSWFALMDRSTRYTEIKQTIRALHDQFGDEVTFVPGGFFANVHNTRNQVNADLNDALGMVEEFMGYRPDSIVAGFLAAENLRYARENLGVKTAQGNIFSQYSIDNQDGDGSIAYPYYPSKEHFCKPAQGENDFIDILNLDGWTVDLVAARMVGDYWKEDVRYVSRMGVGPIETLHTFGRDKGLEIMQQTTESNLSDENLARNPFGWVTVNYEISEVNRARHMGALEGFSDWMSWIKSTWPDAAGLTIGNMGREIRDQHPNNDNLKYILRQVGTGTGASFAGQEVTWFMRQPYRLGLLREGGQNFVFDFTDYRLPYSEPQELGQRNWTLFGEINQKQTRPQDKPRPLAEFARWPQLRQELMQAFTHVEGIEKLLPER